MFANNRKGTAPRAVFRTAGGSIYTYAHPFLTGQVSVASQRDSVFANANEVNISSALRLNDTFFNAVPNQDNAIQEVMVDGSTITITNHVMAGRATLQVVPGTGLVKDGDLTAIAPFIISSKDNVGGVLTRRRFTSAGALTRVYYGVSFANVPHDVDAGNAVPIYPMQMLYGGWIEGLMDGGIGVDKVLWAVGNQYGLQGNFRPFTINGIGLVSVGGVNDQQAVEIDTLQNADGNTLGSSDIAGNEPGGHRDLTGQQNFSTPFI